MARRDIALQPEVYHHASFQENYAAWRAGHNLPPKSGRGESDENYVRLCEAMRGTPSAETPRDIDPKRNKQRRRQELAALRKGNQPPPIGEAPVVTTPVRATQPDHRGDPRAHALNLRWERVWRTVVRDVPGLLQPNQRPDKANTGGKLLTQALMLLDRELFGGEWSSTVGRFAVRWQSNPADVPERPYQVNVDTTDGTVLFLVRNFVRWCDWRILRNAQLSIVASSGQRRFGLLWLGLSPGLDREIFSTIEFILTILAVAMVHAFLITHPGQHALPDDLRHLCAHWLGRWPDWNVVDRAATAPRFSPLFDAVTFLSETRDAGLTYAVENVTVSDDLRPHRSRPNRGSMGDDEADAHAIREPPSQETHSRPARGQTNPYYPKTSPAVPLNVTVEEDDAAIEPEPPAMTHTRDRCAFRLYTILCRAAGISPELGDDTMRPCPALGGTRALLAGLKAVVQRVGLLVVTQPTDAPSDRTVAYIVFTPHTHWGMVVRMGRRWSLLTGPDFGWPGRDTDRAFGALPPNAHTLRIDLADPPDTVHIPAQHLRWSPHSEVETYAEAERDLSRSLYWLPAPHADVWVVESCQRGEDGRDNVTIVEHTVVKDGTAGYSVRPRVNNGTNVRTQAHLLKVLRNEKHTVRRVGTMVANAAELVRHLPPTVTAAGALALLLAAEERAPPGPDDASATGDVWSIYRNAGLSVFHWLWSDLPAVADDMVGLLVQLPKNLLVVRPSRGGDGAWELVCDDDHCRLRSGADFAEVLGPALVEAKAARRIRIWVVTHPAPQCPPAVVRHLHPHARGGGAMDWPTLRAWLARHYEMRRIATQTDWAAFVNMLAEPECVAAVLETPDHFIETLRWDAAMRGFVHLTADHGEQRVSDPQTSVRSAVNLWRLSSDRGGLARIRTHWTGPDGPAYRLIRRMFQGWHAWKSPPAASFFADQATRWLEERIVRTADIQWITAAAAILRVMPFAVVGVSEPLPPKKFFAVHPDMAAFLWFLEDRDEEPHMWLIHRIAEGAQWRVVRRDLGQKDDAALDMNHPDDVDIPTEWRLTRILYISPWRQESAPEPALDVYAPVQQGVDIPPWVLGACLGRSVRLAVDEEVGAAFARHHLYLGEGGHTETNMRIQAFLGGDGIVDRLVNHERAFELWRYVSPDAREAFVLSGHFARFLTDHHWHPAGTLHGDPPARSVDPAPKRRRKPDLDPLLQPAASTVDQPSLWNALAVFLPTEFPAPHESMAPQSVRSVNAHLRRARYALEELPASAAALARWLQQPGALGFVQRRAADWVAWRLDGKDHPKWRFVATSNGTLHDPPPRSASDPAQLWRALTTPGQPTFAVIDHGRVQRQHRKDDARRRQWCE